MINRIRWWLFLVLAFCVCAMLAIVPLIAEYQWFRPQWMLLLVIFCQAANPKSFNPLLAWFFGLLLDNLLGTKLGVHALVFALVCYVVALLVPRMQLRPLWQQVGKVFLLVCLGQILLLWFHALEGKNPHTLTYWFATLTSTMVWPLFVFVCSPWCRSPAVGRSYSRSM